MCYVFVGSILMRVQLVVQPSGRALKRLQDITVGREPPVQGRLTTSCQHTHTHTSRPLRQLDFLRFIY